MSLLSSVILRGLFASRPTDYTALTVGRLYFSSDTGELFRDNGSGWDTVTVFRPGSYLELPEVAAPGTPASGFGRLYVKSNGLFYWKDDAGTEYAPSLSNHTHLAADAFDYSVRATSTSALPGTPTYANGTAGVGATLTRGSNGAITSQDSVTLVNGDKFLVKNQAAGLQNGLYIVTDVGSAGTPYILTRDPLADTDAELALGLEIFVQEGATNADTGWRLTTNNPITVGTTSLTFVQATEAGIITADGVTVDKTTARVMSVKLRPFVQTADNFTPTVTQQSWVIDSQLDDTNVTLPTGSTFDGVEYTFVLWRSAVGTYAMNINANAADTIGIGAVATWGTVVAGDVFKIKYHFARLNWVVLYAGNPGI